MGKIVAAEEGATPLMYACQQAREKDVYDLISNKPRSIHEVDRTHKTALHYCAEAQTTACAELLLKHAPDLLEARDDDGFTALHLAVIAGNMGLLQLLIAKGANVNAMDNEKHSPVHWATVCGEKEALETIIKAGASISTADIHGGYPLHYAAQMCGPGVETGVNARVGLSILRTLLAHGANVEEKDKDGRQPILWAASADAQSRDPRARFTSSGSSEAILALVKANASVDAADKDGLTALHCAASRGHTDCLETLIAFCGANVDLIDHNGCTPLFYAVTLGHADATQLLLSLGAEPNRQDRKGRTPAHCGAAKGQLETLRLLLASGANLWLRNVKGDVPLHEAVASGRKELVRWLLNQRAESANIANNDGKCPIHVAAINNNVDMIKILLDAGSLVNPIMRSSKGTMMTPLDTALLRGHRSSAKFLQLHGGVPFNKLNDSAAALKGSMPREMITQVATERLIDSSDAFMVIPESTTSRFLHDPQIIAEDLAIQHIERIKDTSDFENIVDESNDDEQRSRRRRRRKKSERRRSQSFESKGNESNEDEVVDHTLRPRRKSSRRRSSDDENFKRVRRKSKTNLDGDLPQDGNCEKSNSSEDSQKFVNSQEVPKNQVEPPFVEQSLPEHATLPASSNDTSHTLKEGVDEKISVPEKINELKDFKSEDNNEIKSDLPINSSFDENLSESYLIQTEALVHEQNNQYDDKEEDSVPVETVIDKELPIEEPSSNIALSADENNFLTADSAHMKINKNELKFESKIIKRRQSQPGISRKDSLEDYRRTYSQPSSRRSSRERGDWSKNDPKFNFTCEWDGKSTLGKNDTFYPLDDVETVVGTMRLGEADGRSASVGEESNASTRNEDSSLMLDSGIEPSPRRMREPHGATKRISQRVKGSIGEQTDTKMKNMRLCRRGKQEEKIAPNYSITQAVQRTIRKYHLERKLFYQLLELKRLQIRAGRSNEQVLVKRLSDEYHRSGQAAGLKFYNGPFTFHQFETFLYDQLHALQTGNRIAQVRPSEDMETLSEILKRSDVNSLENLNPALCTSSTHRCFHATHAYTGIPCAAYITKMNHHTMPKDNFLPKIDLTSSNFGTKKPENYPVTLEVIHGKEKQVIELPTEKLNSNKRYYVSFTIKGGPTTPVDTPNDIQQQGRQRHAKSF